MYRLFLVQDFMLLGGVAFLTLTAVFVSGSLTLLIHHSLENAVFILYSMANGQFRNKIDLNRKDQLGDFFRGIFSTQVKMNSQLTESKQVATDALRINRALDDVQSGVMVLNKDLNIIYMNNAIRKIFNTVETDFRKQLPDFNADKLMGSHISIFQQADLQQSKWKNLNTYHSDLVINNRFMSINISPVVEADGQPVGFVAEWLDRTDEVQMEHEIESLVAKIKAGALDSRIQINAQQGFLKTLGTGINQLTDVIECVFDDINRVMDAMAQGDLTGVINNEYRGVYGECKVNINNTLTKMNEFMGEIRNAANFIDESSQEISGGNKNLSQRSVQKVRTGTTFVNESGLAFNEIITSIGKVGDIVSQIAIASSEQSHGISLVNSSLAELDDITQQNATLAEQAAAGSLALTELSTNMSSLLNFITVKSINGMHTRQNSTSATLTKSAQMAKKVTHQTLSQEKLSVSNSEWEEF